MQFYNPNPNLSFNLRKCIDGIEFMVMRICSYYLYNIKEYFEAFEIRNAMFMVRYKEPIMKVSEILKNYSSKSAIAKREISHLLKQIYWIEDSPIMLDMYTYKLNSFNKGSGLNLSDLEYMFCVYITACFLALYDYTMMKHTFHGIAHYIDSVFEFINY